MIDVKEAISLILGEAREFVSEEISIDDCYGRILAEEVHADRDYPPFNRSAMDGFALRHEDLSSYTNFKIIEEVHAGSIAEKKIQKGTCIKIMTGAPVPEEADLVIKVEDARIESTKVSFKSTDLSPWTNISKKGEDIKQGEIILNKGQACTPNVISVLAVLGKARVRVFTLPKISIISTGNELVPPGSPVLPHQIRDSNSFALKGFLMDYHCKVHKHLLIKDDKESIQNALTSLMNSDILILSGGVSMGDADFVPEALEASKVSKLFHKVAIKPGKPIWFGRSANKGVVFGLPGNPMSCQVAFKVFIEPYLRKCFSMGPSPLPIFRLSSDKKKKTKFDEYFPCKFSNGKESTELLPVQFNGSGDVLSTLQSDGLAIHPSGTDNLLKGDTVYFIPWKQIR
jgi:molybdopterin molybdotransferase